MTERYYSWDEARKLAREDPEVDLSGEGPAYILPEVFEEDVVEDVTPEAVLEGTSETPAQEKETRPATTL